MRIRPLVSALLDSTPLASPKAALRAPVVRPVGESPIYVRLLKKIGKYAAHDAIPVLFEGETGTGKTILARYLHSVSPRARAPFVAIDVGVLDDGTASSELFGHSRGAFTGAVADTRGRFAEAHGGIVFIDELQNASFAIQQRLLLISAEQEMRQLGASRDLQVDIRIVAGANVPLADLVAQRRFLPDLAARLSGGLIRVPALRDHPDDVPALVNSFVAQFWRGFGYDSPPTIHAQLMEALKSAPWPDNVRGLRFVVQRLMIESNPAPVIALEHCEDELAFLRESGLKRVRQSRGEAKRFVQQFGSVAAAARHCGVSRATMYRLLSAPENAPVSSEQADPSLPTEESHGDA